MSLDYERLVRKNILKIRPYIPGKPIEEVKRELELKEVIKMASNENPLGPAPKAMEAIIKSVTQINLYPDGDCYYLKKALAGRLGVKENNLIIGNGADEIITFIVKTFLNPEEEAIIPRPSFPIYENVTKVMNGRGVFVDLKNFALDLKAMLQAVTRRTKIVFICNPNNPTGTVVTKNELEEFLASLSNRVIIVMDEAYFEFVDDPNYPNGIKYIKEDCNIICLRSFSKIYGLAGLRIGYGIARQEFISYMNLVREPFNVNRLAQVAALAALEDQDYVERVKKANREGRDYLYEKFEELGLSYIPTQANFILVNLKRDADSIFQRLLRAGVIVRPGGIFGLPQFLRVTIGTREENRKFIKALGEALRE